MTNSTNQGDRRAFAERWSNRIRDLARPWPAAALIGVLALVGFAERARVPPMLDLARQAEPFGFKVAGREEVLILDAPDLGEEALLLYQNESAELAEIAFTDARFSPNTLAELVALGLDPPTGRRGIHYGTKQELGGSSPLCSTEITVALADGTRPLSQLRLLLRSKPEDHIREVELMPLGGDLSLRLQFTAEAIDGGAPACVPWLRTGAAEKAAGSSPENDLEPVDVWPPFGHEIVAEAGSRIHLRIPQVFETNVALLSEGDGKLHCRRVEVCDADTVLPGSCRGVLRAQGDLGMLPVGKLELAADAIELSLRGPGVVEGPKVGAEASRWTSLQRHPWMTAMVVGLDIVAVLALGLLGVGFTGWLARKTRPAAIAGAFQVFLSHNSRDKPAVRRLAKALTRRGVKVWLDEWELQPGRSWQQGLEEAIRTCLSVAVVVGRDGLGPWEIPEMEGALIEGVRRGIPVVPVLLPGVRRKPDLPLFLKRYTWVDLRKGMTAERLDRLVWGITGKKPADAADQGGAADA